MKDIAKHTDDFFEVIYKNSNEANLILEGDRIIQCNNSAHKLFGFLNQEDLIGKAMWELSPNNQQDGVLSRKKSLHILSKVSNNEKQVFDWLFLKNDESEFYCELTLSRIDFRGCVYTQASIRDSSWCKELENELVVSKEKAQNSEQLKTSFLANMSHDIRNPLNAILGFSKMLADDTEVSVSERRRYGELIEINGNNLLNLINDIIDVSLIEANQMLIEKKRCKINGLMEELYLTFQRTAARNNLKLKLNIAVDDVSFSIYSDPMRIRQVLSNLISNAIKYTKQGFVEFGYQLVDGKTIQFFVKDSGLGISPEHLENIFDRFNREVTNQTKAIRGTGLGLDISKRLVTLLGGKIWVFSTLNKGSEFYFSIPALYLDYKPIIKNEVVRNKPLSAHDVDWSDKHILIADDDVINFELLRIILGKTKVKITKAINGKEAIDFINSDKSIDLLLLDIQMPIMNGYEAIKEIRILRPDIPVIAQTAVSLVLSDSANPASQFDDYVSKPIDVETLITKIQSFFS